jgi:hypothetical protein
MAGPTPNELIPPPIVVEPKPELLPQSLATASAPTVAEPAPNQLAPPPIVVEPKPELLPQSLATASAPTVAEPAPNKLIPSPIVVEPKPELLPQSGEKGEVVATSHEPRGFAEDGGAAQESRPARRGRVRRIGLALLVGVASIAAGTLAFDHFHQGGVAGTEGMTSVVGAGPAQARAVFSSPRTYAAAMTRLSLASGSTEVDGKPACALKSTWEHWTCQAKGRPTLGAYVGYRLTYRCSPGYEPQQPLVLLINCRPEKLPDLAT